jgi:hypothetical protein
VTRLQASRPASLKGKRKKVKVKSEKRASLLLLLPFTFFLLPLQYSCSGDLQLVRSHKDGSDFPQLNTSVSVL